VRWYIYIFFEVCRYIFPIFLPCGPIASYTKETSVKAFPHWPWVCSFLVCVHAPYFASAGTDGLKWFQC